MWGVRSLRWLAVVLVLASCQGTGDAGLGSTPSGPSNTLPVSPSPADSPASSAMASSPKAIGITAGAYHTCLLLDDGGVSCWGGRQHVPAR